MKKKTPNRKENSSQKKDFSKEVPLKVVDDLCEDAYRQINSISFKQNFKILIGHYSDEKDRRF